MKDNDKKLSSKRKVQLLRKKIQKSQNQQKLSEQQDVQEQLANDQSPEQTQQIQHQEKCQQKPIIVVLKNAGLHTRKYKGRTILLNYEDHTNFIEKKLGRDSQNYRPDLIHQALLMLLDSTLNKSGNLRVYIETQQNQLIEINPVTKIPRSYKRFSGMIAQLLEKLIIKTGENNEVLLKVIRGPLQVNLPENSYIVQISNKAKVQCLDKYKNLEKQNKNLVFLVDSCGQEFDGQNVDIADEKISLSRYQLSVSNSLCKITDYYENQYDIL